MMKPKTKMILVIVFITTLIANAQKINFSGIVIESNTKEPIAGVLFVLKDNIIAYTDDNGKFNFNLHDSNLKEDITLTHLSYESKTLALKHFKANITIELDVVLTELEEVSIIAKKRLSKKEIIKNAVKNYEKKQRKEAFWSGVNLKQLSIYQDSIQGYLEVDGNIFMLAKKNPVSRIPLIIPIKARRTPETFNKLFPNKDKNKERSFHVGISSIRKNLMNYNFFNKIHPLSKKNIKHFDYVIEDVVDLNGEQCYLINYKQKKVIYLKGRGFHFMRGQLWITKSDFNLKKTSSLFRRSDYNTVKEKGPDCIFTIDYQEYNNITYPKSIYYIIDYDANWKSLEREAQNIYTISGVLTFTKIDETIRENYLKEHNNHYDHFIWSDVYNEFDESYWHGRRNEDKTQHISFLKLIENEVSKSSFKEGVLQKIGIKRKDIGLEIEELEMKRIMELDLKIN